MVIQILSCTLGIFVRRLATNHISIHIFPWLFAMHVLYETLYSITYESRSDIHVHTSRSYVTDQICSYYDVIQFAYCFTCDF